MLTSEHIAHECNEWDCVMFLIDDGRNCYAQCRAWKTAIQERLCTETLSSRDILPV